MLVSKPSWLKQREKESHKTGILDLSHDVITDLTVISSHPFLKVLDLSLQSIPNLKGLPKMPNLSKFIANKSAIESYAGFDAIESVTALELEGTPLSKAKTFKLSAMFVFKKLTSINKRMIPQSVKEKYNSFDKSYLLDIKDLVCSGWLVTYPCPDDVTLMALMKEYGMINTYDDATVYKAEKQKEESEGDQPMYGGESILQTRSLLKAKKAFFSPPTGNSISDEDDSFVKNIKSITKKHDTIMKKKEEKFHKVLQIPLIAGEGTDIRFSTTVSSEGTETQSYANSSSSLPPSPERRVQIEDHQVPQNQSFSSQYSGSSTYFIDQRLSLRKQVVSLLTHYGINLENTDEQTILETLEILLEKSEGKDVTLPLQSTEFKHQPSIEVQENIIDTEEEEKKETTISESSTEEESSDSSPQSLLKIYDDEKDETINN